MKQSFRFLGISTSNGQSLHPDEAELIPVITQFTRNAEKHPDHPALVVDRVYSYGELNALSNRLAHAILAVRGEEEEPVLFLSGREMASVVSILGIWKVGKFYVALDPSNPEDRLKAIVEDAQSHILVCNNRNLALAQNLSKGKMHLINLDEIDPTLSSGNPAVPISCKLLAAVFFTSGSTGKPKGVMLDHIALSDLSTYLLEGNNQKSDDRYLQPNSFSFANSLGAFLSAFITGGSLYICDFRSMTVLEIAHFLLDNKITHARMTPSMFARFLDTLPEDFAEKFPDLRSFLVGGEAFDPRYLEKWKKRFSAQSVLVVSLASTEAGGIAIKTYNWGSKVSEKSGNVGEPRQGIELFIMDDSGKDLGKNQPGRIGVKSKGIMRGYWRLPDLNANMFIPDPHDPAEKILLTEDLGRLLDDGSLEFLGRADAMIKIRGFRIDPGEVEASFRQHPAVEHAAAAGWPNPNTGGEIALVGYVVLKPDLLMLPSQLREFLLSKLPEYMVPTHYVFLEQLPLNRNSKLDRSALPEPDWTASPSGSEYVAPRSEVEKFLATLWQEVIGKEKVGIQDDFFMLGGHSLAAFRMMSRVEEKLGVKVPLQILVQHATIAALAPIIEHMHATPKQRSIIELRGGTFPALFMIPGGARSALSSTKFSRLIEAPGRVYGLEYPGMGGYLEPLERIESLASFFITEIRSVQPSGPYYLGGFCLGGVIAFEIAHQLKAQGQEIGLVSLLDSSPPGMKDDELDNPGRWYYFERLKTLFNAENRRNALSFIRSRLRRIRLFGNGHRSSQSPPRRRSRIKLSDGIKTPLDEQSLQVIAGLQKARKNYRPELLEAQGLVVLSSMAKGTPREVWWSRLFTVFNCHYIPNTIHNNIFSDASLLQLARLVSLAIQQDQSRRLV